MAELTLEDHVGDGGNLAANGLQTYMTFQLSDQYFAVDVRNVREVLDIQTISKLPNAPSDVIGMIDVRGEGIAILDIASRLGMGLKGAETARMIVFELSHNDENVPIGVVADRVLDVVDIHDSDIEAAPPTMTSWSTDTISGVARLGQDVVIILSLNRTFDISSTDLDAFSFSSSQTLG